MRSLELTPPVFSILSSLIEEKAGLHFGLLDQGLLQDRAASRAADAGFDSMLDYYYFLRYDPAGVQELKELVENLVVNETYFFREWPAIETLVDSFITPWCATGRRPRIWSAACSTGEEPLSLAMLLSERGLLDRVEIVASDISTRATQKAKSGKFRKRSLRSIPVPHLVERHLKADGNEIQVSSSLIDSIQWKNLNLLDEAAFATMGFFDAILCRNVLIYFSDSTVKGLLNRFSRSLPVDGVLMVGVSESLLRFGSGFNGEEHGGAFVYRKASTS